ncbi:MAG: hypothetical protein IJ048_06160 [Clostridia bacterium]|nr:hypothetical protein [Clostridia bacterium]
MTESLKNTVFTARGQGASSADSMPLGGGSLGVNVWTQEGQLMLYACDGGGYDENGTLLKLGRLRVKPDRNLIGDDVRQTLYADEGRMVVCGDDWSFALWADVSGARLHLSYDGVPTGMTFFWDVWRYRDRPITSEEMGQCRDLLVFGEGATRADRVEAADGRILCRHVNRGETVFDKLIRQQRLDGLRDLYNDILTGRVSGCLLEAPDTRYAGCQRIDMRGTDAMSYALEGVEDRAHWTLTLTALAEQVESEAAWERALLESAAQPVDEAAARARWRARFERSYILIDPRHPDSEDFAIGRNYALYRYMQLCSASNPFPIKFNGGLFTFHERHTPDFRAWGGTDCVAQNQRLVYWPMLKNGDFDLMKPPFELYRRVTPAQAALTRRELGHGGAFFDEHITLFGMTCAAEYEMPGRGRRAEIPVWEMDNPWVRLEFSSALEFACMILEYRRFTGRDISEYLGFIDGVARFYFEHYALGDDGRLRVFPSTALETYKGRDPYAADANEYGATDPMDAVAGLRALLTAVIAQGLDRRGEYAAWLEKCPSLPQGERNGHRQFLPARSFTMPPFNCELPQLYRVFPYGFDGLTEEDIRLGVSTWRCGIDTEDQRLPFGWHQNGIFAARLGLLEDAMAYLRAKLGDSGRRFPAFWGPGHDWTPDFNHGGSGAIQLQEMLLNTDGGSLCLFPCWPKDIDVHFRLHAPGGVAVEAEQVEGKARVIGVSADKTER